MHQTDFFKCLSDPTRLSIVQLLLQHGDICVCELTDYLQLSQPKISRHLALLRAHGVLMDQRKGQWVYYRLHPELPDWARAICQTLQQHAEQSHTEQNHAEQMPTKPTDLNRYASSNLNNPNFCE